MIKRYDIRPRRRKTAGASDPSRAGAPVAEQGAADDAEPDAEIAPVTRPS
jgi:hypothetical protein